MTQSDTRPRLKIAQLDAFDDRQVYWTAIEPIWEIVSIYEGPDYFLQSFSAVREAQALLLASHWCQSEVCNGGFHQFFSNPTGVLAPEAERAFRFLELNAVSEIVGNALRVFGTTDLRAQPTRTAALRRLERPGQGRSSWDPFANFDQLFYAQTGTTAFAEQASRFVRANVDLFFRIH